MVRKSTIYYTDNLLDPVIAAAAQWQLYDCRYSDEAERDRFQEIVAVSLKELPWCSGGTWLEVDKAIVLHLERSPLTMFRQILAGLEYSTAEVVYLTEHDVLYHPCHFDFTPPDPSIVYYNKNVWQVRCSDGHAVYWEAKRVSQLCAYRELLVEHYRKRIEMCDKVGFSRRMGFEPGSHGRKERVDDLKSEYWVSDFPNLDLKHGKNLTEARWRQDQFRSPRSCRGWAEMDEEIAGWGQIYGRFNEFLDGL